MADYSMGACAFLRIQTGPPGQPFGKSIEITGKPGIITFMVTAGQYDVFIRRGVTMASPANEESLRVKPGESVRWDNTQGDETVQFQAYSDGPAVLQVISGCEFG